MLIIIIMIIQSRKGDTEFWDIDVTTLLITYNSGYKSSLGKL